MAHKMDFANRDRLRDSWRREHLDPATLWRRAGLASGSIAVDVGAGIGYFSVPAADLVGPTGKVYAADILPEMLADLRAFLPAAHAARLETVNSTEYSVPLADQIADVVLLSFVAHEVDDPARLIQECSRLLKPGGHLLVLDWDPGVEPPPGPPTEHRLAEEALVSALTTASLSVDARRPAAPGVYEVLATRRP